MYHLVEIFESLQGEGRNVGKQVVFVRFANCNLHCAWCDTAYAPRFSLTRAELVKEILSHKTRNVIFTGGEPTLVDEMPELITDLKKANCWLAIETNATREVEWLAFLDYVACSPKVEFPDKIALTRADEVRVVASASNISEFCNMVKQKISATDYYLSPCERNGEIDFATAKEELKKLKDWSLSVQLHKVLGFR